MASYPIKTQLVQSAYASPRVTRRPEHTFYIESKPYILTPFCIAPVLPGETLKSLVWQARCVTDPINNPLIGWWLEHYWFYIKHRDFLGSAESATVDLGNDLVSMMTDPTQVITESASATSDMLYTAQGTVSYVHHCLIRVVEEYFRDEGEALVQASWTAPEYVVQHGMSPGVIESIVDGTLMPTDTVDANIEDLDQSYRAWRYMTEVALINMSYEDFLRSYGIRGRDAQEPHKPELLRYTRSWQYPSNTIDPSSGAPRSAVSWAVSERADKDRFFSEPGFIFGCTVARPKVYMSKLVGCGAGLLDRVQDWLPPVLDQDDFTSLKEFAADTGVLYGNTTNGYWIDIRDLYVYGDQFTNIAAASRIPTNNHIDLPTAALQRKYPVANDSQDVFVTQDGTKRVRQDGIANFNILGRQRDRT